MVAYTFVHGFDTVDHASSIRRLIGYLLQRLARRYYHSLLFYTVSYCLLLRLIYSISDLLLPSFSPYLSLDSSRPNRYPSKKPIINIAITYCLYYNEPDVVVSTIGVSTIGAFLGALGASTTGVGVSFTTSITPLPPHGGQCSLWNVNWL